MIAKFLPDPERVRGLLNRVVLAARFFRATNTTRPIHQAEFGFTYLDGDRSPATKKIAGVFEHEEDQPDTLQCVARSSTAAVLMGSHQRRALVMGRRDARGKLPRKSDLEIFAGLGITRAQSGLSGPVALLRQIVRRSYDAAYDAFPGWAPAEALSPPVIAPAVPRE